MINTFLYSTCPYTMICSTDGCSIYRSRIYRSRCPVYEALDSFVVRQVHLSRVLKSLVRGEENSPHVRRDSEYARSVFSLLR